MKQIAIAALAFLAGTALAREPNQVVPLRLLGEWCQVKNDEYGSELFYLGDCSNTGGTALIKVRPDGFSLESWKGWAPREDVHKMDCKMIEGWWRRAWSYQMQVSCRTSEGATVSSRYHLNPRLDVVKLEQ